MTPDEQVSAVRALVDAEPTSGQLGGTTMVGRLHQLCTAAVRSLEVDGASVTLMLSTDDGVVTASSDESAAALADVQLTLGEGPVPQAYRDSRPVLQPDLASTAGRWPVFAAAAADLAVGAVFALPLQVGAARLGVLGLHRVKPEPLAGPVLTRALTFADVAVGIVLDALGRESSADLPVDLSLTFETHYVVYQAQGMIMVDLGLPLAEALVRLRAAAFALGRPLHEVADDVVNGRLRLDGDG